ncbi:MAG: hypothetical protein GY856_28770 [bacterium]|nr:hypothetical protein [bacterium]
MKKEIALAVLAVVAVGLLAGCLGFLIRGSYDRPDISLAAVQVTLPREPIAMSHDARERVRIAGAIHAFLEPRVTWPYRDALVANSFKRHYVGDMLELLPKLDEQQRRTIALYNEQKPTLEAIIRGEPYNQEVLFTIVSQKRERLAQSHKVDIASEFQNDTPGTARMILGVIEGDIQQLNMSLETSGLLQADFTGSYEAGAPEPLAIVGEEIPNVTFSIVVMNTGRSDGVLLGRATLAVGGEEAVLIRYDEAMGRRDRDRGFQRIGAAAPTEIAYAFDLDENEHDVLRSVYERLVADEGPFSFTMECVCGERYRIKLDSLPQSAP